jgi:hypothetical protein
VSAAPASQLGVPHTRLTAVGLCVRSGLRFDEWASLGERIATVSAGSSWSLGDWLNYGEQAYGNRYRTAITATRFDYQTLRNLAWVARAFEMSRRRDTVSFSHHAEVAALPQPEQELWLTRAEQLRWSRNELRRQIASHPPRLRRNGQPTLRVPLSLERERRWREAAAVHDQELMEWIGCELDAAADAALGPTPGHRKPALATHAAPAPHDLPPAQPRLRSAP